MTTPNEPTPETRTDAETEALPATAQPTTAQPTIAQPAPAAAAPKSRRIPGGPLAAIIVGAVLAAAMVFGGGVALGINLPVGGGGTHQPAFDRDGGGRMELPGRGDRTHTNPDAPSGPNQDDTETQDESEQG
jgi:hypothetical protein